MRQEHCASASNLPQVEQRAALIPGRLGSRFDFPFPLASGQCVTAPLAVAPVARHQSTCKVNKRLFVERQHDRLADLTLILNSMVLLCMALHLYYGRVSTKQLLL